MNYITVEQFLEQPQEVQKVLLEWFNFNQNEKTKRFSLVAYQDESKIDLWKNKDNYKCDNTIPLFLETQLRKFIEEKTKIKYDIIYSKGKNRFINFYDISTNEDKPIYTTKGHDLLHAYWQVVCQVAKE